MKNYMINFILAMTLTPETLLSGVAPDNRDALPNGFAIEGFGGAAQPSGKWAYWGIEFSGSIASRAEEDLIKIAR